MINKENRVGSGYRPRLRLLDLTFDNGNRKAETTGRPHGGLRGSKKHPLSPYSFNKPPEYHAEIRSDINRLFHEDFIDGRGSPAWAFDVSREITHSGESPFHVHGLLSTSRLESEVSIAQNARCSVTPSSSRHTPKKRDSKTSYYRPQTPHQYLKTTDPQQLSAQELKYGRPTRTTLLRARHRCASAPVNSYDVRREMIKMYDLEGIEAGNFQYSDHCLSCRESENPPPPGQMNKEVFPAPAEEGESSHAFLTGARYNRAHFLDAKSLSVYGVYMPRTNPQGIFMTGHATQKAREKGHTVPAVPPDSPRSDVDETSKPIEKRPSTAPGKRLLSSTPHGRPRSAWGESSTTCHIMHGDTEKVVLVTFKGSKQGKATPESVLPSVTGKTAPKMYYRRPRDLIDDTSSLHNQPPPTPTGIFSARDGSERGPPENSVQVGEGNSERNIDDDANKLDKIIEKVLDENSLKPEDNTEIQENSPKPVDASEIPDSPPKPVDDSEIPDAVVLTAFESKKDIDPSPNIENVMEETLDTQKLRDDTKLTLDEHLTEQMDGLSYEKKSDEFFITNHNKDHIHGEKNRTENNTKDAQSTDHVIKSDIEVDQKHEQRKNPSETQNNDVSEHEEIPTRIHVTIIEKTQESNITTD